MMLQFRAALINAASRHKSDYHSEMIDSLLMHQAYSNDPPTIWYAADKYELDKETKKFILKNPVMCLLNESNKDVFIDKIKGHYCMLGTSVGSLMCYFSNGCNLVEDSSTGIRSLIAHGRIELILT